MIKSLDYPYVSLRRNYFWLSSKRWSQCDQMVRLFFHIWPFEAMKISPIMWHICQSMLSISPNKKWAVKILPSTCKHLPNLVTLVGGLKRKSRTVAWYELKMKSNREIWLHTKDKVGCGTVGRSVVSYIHQRSAVRIQSLIFLFSYCHLYSLTTPLVDRSFPTYTKDLQFESSHWHFYFLNVNCTHIQHSWLQHSRFLHTPEISSLNPVIDNFYFILSSVLSVLIHSQLHQNVENNEKEAINGP